MLVLINVKPRPDRGYHNTRVQDQTTTLDSSSVSHYLVYNSELGCLLLTL